MATDYYHPILLGLDFDSFDKTKEPGKGFYIGLKALGRGNWQYSILERRSRSIGVVTSRCTAFVSAAAFFGWCNLVIFGITKTRHSAALFERVINSKHLLWHNPFYFVNKHAILNSSAIWASSGYITLIVSFADIYRMRSELCMGGDYIYFLSALIKLTLGSQDYQKRWEA